MANENYQPGDYVLTVGKFTEIDGTEHSYGDVITVEDEKEVKRLVDSGSIAAQDSTKGRKARAEATGDPVERNKLIAEEKRAQAERLLSEADTLEGGESKGEEVAEEARSVADNLSFSGGEQHDQQTTKDEDEE
jgi:hypothetical protein